MNGIEDRFRDAGDAVDTTMPPSRLTADGVYAAAFRRRRLRVATAATAALAAVAVVVGGGLLPLGRPDPVAGPPNPETTEAPPWLRDGAVVTVAATDARHLVAVVSVCAPNETCFYKLVGSDDAGATWDVRQERFGGTSDREVYSPAAGVLYYVNTEVNPNYVETDPESPKMLNRPRISTDGGRTWRDVTRTTAPVDAVPAGGWLECEEKPGLPCARMISIDPATRRSAPLKAVPDFTMLRIEDVPSANGFWISGYWEDTRRHVVAASTDRGRTWKMGMFPDPLTTASADGVTGYGIAGVSQLATPTGPSPTSSPNASDKKVYRTVDGGGTWEPRDHGQTLPAGGSTVAQGYVAADGTHVVLMSSDGHRRYGAQPYARYTSGDGGETYRTGGVTGLADRLARDPRTDRLVRTSVAGVYLANDDESVYLSTDGLRWRRIPVPS